MFKNFKLYIIIATFILLQGTNCFSAPNFTYSTPDTYQYKPLPVDKNSSEEILFIVDFSNSMNEHIAGQTKLDIAVSTMKDILQQIPKHTKVGFRAYGHKTGFTPRQSCTASQLISPIQQNNAISIYTKIDSINAVGWTPITYSLKQAVNNDFVGTKGKKHIILLTDGGENCDESPCTYVINLMKTRDDVTIDVIAFDVHDIEANNQLKCTALMTSGKFLNANSQEDLANSMFETIGINKDVKGSIKIPVEN